MSDEMIVIEKQELSAQDLKGQVNRIQQMMTAVMQKGEHYGVIPGCGQKPTLLKAGAEKLAYAFRLAPDYPTMDVIADERDDFISYKVRCTLTHIPTGQFAGAGVGACNSRERKYRNNQPWDVQNTLYKMACKRALVAAVLNVTAASDIFTQDLEEMGDQIRNDKPPIQQPQAKAAAPVANKNVISEPQRKRLFAISKKANVSEDVLREYLKTNHGIEHTKDITRDTYESICNWVESESDPFDAAFGDEREPGLEG